MSNQNIKIILSVLALLVLAGCGFFVFRNNQIQENEKPNKGSELSEKEARAIAEKSCVKGGEVLSSGSYNEITKTWWFDANLNATSEGCHPACVVSEETRTAEINWRCTGLIPPDQTNPTAPPISNECGIANCHGLDIECGKPAEMCTMMYQLGDKCRQYVQCGKVNGICRHIENSKFTACKSCVEECETNFPNNPERAFACENGCGE